MADVRVSQKAYYTYRGDGSSVVSVSDISKSFTGLEIATEKNFHRPPSISAVSRVDVFQDNKSRC